MRDSSGPRPPRLPGLHRRGGRRTSALLAATALGLGLLSAPAALAADGPDGPGRLPDGFQRAGGDTVRFGDDDVTAATGTVSGDLQRIVVDHPDGTSRTGYLLTGQDGRSRAVSFGGERVPDAVNGEAVTAQVTRAGAVRSARLETSDEQTAPSATTPVAVRAYVAVVDNRGGYPDDNAGIQATVGRALDRWRTESNGRMSSFALAAYTRFATTTDCSDGPSMWDEAARSFPGVSFSGASANHLVVLAPQACDGGVGTVGSEADGIASGGRLSVNYDPAKNQTSLLHELGHNFSLEHANASYCDADGVSACGDHEYGNHYAFMGVSILHTPAYDPASLDSFERARLGLLDSGEVATVQVPAGRSTAGGSYALQGRGDTSGLRGLRVVDPTSGAVYWVDWRNAGGRDAGSAYADTVGADQETYAFLPGVTVERQISGGDQSELQSHRKPAPGQGYLFSYGAGGTFKVGGTTIRVTAIGATATVSVALAGVRRFATIPTPVMNRNRRVGDLLYVNVRQTSQRRSSWSPSASGFNYHWYVGGRLYARTTKPLLRITSRMVGKQVNCLVTGYHAGYTPGRKYSTLSPRIRR